jgi:hypothetical protein
VCVLRQGEQPQWQLSVEAVIEEHVKVAGAVWVGLQASKRSCCIWRVAMVVASLKSPVQAQNVFAELLDSLIVDVAAEAHRAARLGFDYRLDNEEEEEAQMSAHARATVGDVDIGGSETGGKYTFDVFGLSHPTIAQDIFDCMNCGHPIVAGRFAPHLEKCMGKVKSICTHEEGCQLVEFGLFCVIVRVDC